MVDFPKEPLLQDQHAPIAQSPSHHKEGAQNEEGAEASNLSKAWGELFIPTVYGS